MDAHDIEAKTKYETGNLVLRELWKDRRGVLSTQVLQEFYINVTRKIRAPFQKAWHVVWWIARQFWCIETTPAEILAAFRIEDESQIGFWDALIVSAAAKAGATRILSEDLNAGQRIAGILIENPFVRAKHRANREPKT